MSTIYNTPTSLDQFFTMYGLHWSSIYSWFQKTITNTHIIIALLAIMIALGTAILWNQRKIKKQLRELLDQKEDKP